MRIFYLILILVKIITQQGQVCIFLPPASEGWGRQCFHRYLSVHTQGLPQSQVLSLVSGPRSFPGSTPVLAGWVPLDCHTPSQDRTGVLPQLGQDWGTPLARTGQGYPTPSGPKWCTPQPGQQSEYLLCGGAVCLLRSRRRTFLFRPPTCT